jgi:hypothetical protein
MSEFDDNEKKLPWPDESDPAKLGDRFEREATPDAVRDGREAGESFVARNEASERVLGREFADPAITDGRKVGEAFADPNSKDDRRIGKNFEETNFSGKKKKPPLKERIHKPANRRPLYIGLVVFAVHCRSCSGRGRSTRRPIARRTRSRPWKWRAWSARRSRPGWRCLERRFH